MVRAGGVLPPRTKPLVAMAEVDRPVMVVTTVAIRIMAIVNPISNGEGRKSFTRSRQLEREKVSNCYCYS